MLINQSIHEHQKILELKEEGMSNRKIFLSLLKSMITTGILYQPRSFYLGGLAFSLVSCVVVGYLIAVCMSWVSLANDRVGGTFSDISGKAMGHLGVYFLDAIIFITQFGPGIVNVGFMTDIILTAFSIFGVSISQYILMVVILAILMPLCLIKSLKDQSVLHISADFIIVSSILIIGLYSSINSSASDVSVINPNYMIYTLGTLVYGFESIPLLLPIKEVMQNPREFNKIVSYMIATIVLIFLWFAVVCNFAYGGDLKDLVILNLPKEPWVGLILIGYSLAVMFTMPLVLNPVFTISEKYLKISGRKTYYSRVSFVLVITIIGTLSKEYLGFCVSIIGGFFCSPLALIFPAIINLKINSQTSEDKLKSWLMIITGIFFGISAVFSTIYFNI